MLLKATLQDKPRHEAYPEELWYCHSADCSIREVVAVHKHLGAVPDRRKALRCPSCGGRLEFLTYLEEMPLGPAGRNRRPRR
jgi:hypothetical protein